MLSLFSFQALEKLDLGIWTFGYLQYCLFWSGFRLGFSEMH